MVERIQLMSRVDYQLDGVLHRTNGRARIWYDGDWAWALYGRWHRYYGPQNQDGDWWIHNESIK